MLATQFEMPQMMTMPVIEITVMPRESIEDVFTFAEAIVGGFASRSNLSELTTCLGAIDADQADVEEIIADFETPSLSSIIDGAKKLVALVTDQKIQECANMGDDFKRIEAWGTAIFTNPAQIASNVEKNVMDILTEVPKISKDYDAGSFKSAGDDIAQVVVDVFGAAPSQAAIADLY